jgi:hypothetical protein
MPRLLSASERSRVGYCVLFLCQAVLAWVLRDVISPLITPEWYLRIFLFEDEECANLPQCVAKANVIRLCFAFFMFYFAHVIVFLIMAARQKSLEQFASVNSYDLRTWPMHDTAYKAELFLAHYWIPKLVVLFLFMGLSLLINSDALLYIGYFGFFSGGLFLFLQIITLVDFAYFWKENWSARRTLSWQIGIRVMTAVLYILSAGLLAIMVHWFVPSTECVINLVVLLETALAALLLSIVSSLDAVERGSLLTSAVVTVYCTFLCWAAMAGETGTGCNTDRDDFIDFHRHLGILIATNLLTLFSTTYDTFSYLTQQPADTSEVQYISINARAKDMAPPKFGLAKLMVVYATASTYLMSTYSSWNLTHVDTEPDAGTVAFWIMISAQILTVLLYAWSLLGPLILRRCINRDDWHDE